MYPSSAACEADVPEAASQAAPTLHPPVRYRVLGVFLFAVAGGTLIGGPRWTLGLSVVIGLILSSAFPAIIMLAQDMLTHRIGMVSGLFYGFSFGLGGLGAAALGVIADHAGSEFVNKVCAFLPLLGLLAWLLPDVRPAGEPAQEMYET